MIDICHRLNVAQPLIFLQQIETVLYFLLEQGAFFIMDLNVTKETIASLYSPELMPWQKMYLVEKNIKILNKYVLRSFIYFF